MSCLAVRAAIDRLSAALARAAAAFVRLRAWNVFGFARVEDHARERYGRSGRWLRDLATLGDGIAASPTLARALTGADGGRPLGRVAATLVARALELDPPALESIPAAGWIAVARRLSVRDLRDAIRVARTKAESRGDPKACATNDRAEAAAPAGAARAGLESETDPDADRSFLRLPVPAPILAAFEEARELHRAVEGRETSLSEFVESVVGEAQSGGLTPEPGLLGPLESGLPAAQVEAALRRASGAWEALPEPGKALPESQDATQRWPGRPGLLERFAEVEAGAGEGDAVELDRQIAALVRLEDELEAGLGRLLAGMAERRDWLRLHFAGVGHYAEERLGMSRSRAGERARLARALRSLPAVAAASSEGRISMEAAALVQRILADHADQDSADLEAAWVDHASRITIKRMRDEARALGRYRVCPRPPLDGGSGGPPPLSDEQWSASLHRQAGTALHRIREFGLRTAGVLPPAPGIPPGQTTPGQPPKPLGPDVFHPAPAPEPDVFHPAPDAEPDVFHALPYEADTFLRLRLPADLAVDFLAAIEAARARAEERAASAPWDAAWPSVGDGAVVR